MPCWVTHWLMALPPPPGAPPPPPRPTVFDQDVADLALGHQLLELGQGGGGIGAVEAADGDHRLTAGDDDRIRGVGREGGHEVFGAVAMGFEIGDQRQSVLDEPPGPPPRPPGRGPDTGIDPLA